MISLTESWFEFPELLGEVPHGISAGPHRAVRKSRVRRARPLAPRRNGARRTLLELQLTASQRAATAANAFANASQAADQLSSSPSPALKTARRWQSVPRLARARARQQPSALASHVPRSGRARHEFVADLVAAPSSPQPSCVVECSSTHKTKKAPIARGLFAFRNYPSARTGNAKRTALRAGW